MRKAIIFLLLLVYGLSCFGQEKLKVDIDGAATKTAPKVTSGKEMSGDNSRPNLIWRVDLAISTGLPAESPMLEIRIVNVSPVSRTLPVSQDGVKLVAECPNHTVFEGAIFLAGSADTKYLHKIGYFYGCEKFPATLVQSKPGEWVSYTTKVSSEHLPKEVRAQIRFAHTRYRQTPNGQTAEDLEYGMSEFSPWVQVPEASGANK
jgi:hypothetical protein